MPNHNNEIGEHLQNAMDLLGIETRGNTHEDDIANLTKEELFLRWLSKQTKADGTLRFVSGSINNCRAAMRVLPRKFNVNSIYEIETEEDLKSYVDDIKSRPNFNEINRGYSNGWIKNGLDCYMEFFSQYQAGTSANEEVPVFTYITSEKQPIQVIYYGAPGTGKSFEVDKVIKEKYPDENEADEHSYRVVFHPEYTYSDFVGSIRPTKDDNDDLNYDFIPGPFVKVLKECFLHPSEDFYLVLEEINRGNAAAIFGDIFQLLDRKENGESKYSINNKDVADLFASSPLLMQDNRLQNGFNAGRIWLPNNFNIICTMNTADQNVFVLDTAFKRRFALNYIKIDFSILDNEKPELAEETEVFADSENLKDVFDGSIIKEYVDLLDSHGALKRNWPTFARLVNAIIDSINTEGGSEQIPEDKKLGPFFVTKDDIKDRKSFVNKVVYYLKQDVFKYVDICMTDSFQNIYSDYTSNNPKYDIFKVLYIKQ